MVTRRLTFSQVTVDPKTEGFRLRDVMVCNILKNKDELEDICISAKKEQEIDQKLKQVIADWAIQELEFGTFKVNVQMSPNYKMVRRFPMRAPEELASLVCKILCMNTPLIRRFWASEAIFKILPQSRDTGDVQVFR